MFSNRLWPYWLASWGSLCILVGIAGCRGMPSAAYTPAISAPLAPRPAANEETSATPTTSPQPTSPTKPIEDMTATAIAATAVTATPTTSPQPTSPTKPIEDMTATAIAATAVTATPTPIPPPPYIRISERGPASTNLSKAEHPTVAYNPNANEYLVVWEDNDTTDGSIYGQRLTADGQEIGPDDFRISAMEPENFSAASEPVVIYNPTANEYLVVWRGKADTGGASEIHGQRLTADGQEIGPDDFRISTMGPDGDVTYSTWSPAVTYNPNADEYLVVWHGADTTPEEFEIHAQRLTADGQEIGHDDFRISAMGPDGDSSYRSYDPAVIYSATADEYLVVWKGRHPLTSTWEIYGQRLNTQGEEIGTDDFRISVTGGHNPAVSYNSTTDQYMVVWNDSHPPIRMTQVFGQRLDTNGQAQGDIVMYSNSRSARLPAVTYNTTTDSYFIVWQGSSSHTTTEDIYGQLVEGQTGYELGVNDRRLSDMQSYNPRSGKASQPAVSYNPTLDEYLVIWEGNTINNGQSEQEIFGYLFNHSDIVRSYDTYLPLVE